jgi:hypothetical protein
MSKPTPATRKTTSWPAHSEALRGRGSLAIWSVPETRWGAAPAGRRGRRQTQWRCPRVAGNPSPRTSYRGSRGRLPLLADNEASTAIGPRTMPNGIKVEGEGEGPARKHGGTKRRAWRKIRLGIDEQTPEIRGGRDHRDPHRRGANAA